MATATTINQPKVRTPISNSAKRMNLLTAIETYCSVKTPNNLDVDAHLKNGGRLYGSWVLGTGAIYEAPGQKFKKKVKYDGLVFQVPEKYQGLKDAVLVLQSGFNIDGKSGLYTGEVTHVVEEYPTSDGWYAVHKETGIPQGKEISSDNKDARYSYRRNEGNYIGAVVRSNDDFDVDGGSVGLCYGPYDNGLRVALFSQAEPEQSSLNLSVKGYTLEQFNLLLRTADNSVKELTQTTKETTIEPLKKLIRVLEQNQ